MRRWTRAVLAGLALAACTEEPVSGPGPDPAPDVPELCVTPLSVSIIHPADSGSFEVWNCGQDTLTWSVSDDRPWLSCLPVGGSSVGEHDTIRISVDWSDFGPGESGDAVLTLASNGGADSISVMVFQAETYPDTVTVEVLSDSSFVCRPAGEGPFPVVLYNHGGKESDVGGDLRGTCEVLAALGFLARSERRPATLSMDGHIEDVLAGLAELQGHVDADSTRTGVMGFSRGGLLTLQAAIAAPEGIGAVILMAPAPGKGQDSMDATLRNVSPVGAPVRIFVAENDTFQAEHVEIAEEVLDSLLAETKDAELTIYGPFGTDGHELFFEVRDPYWTDVTAFLEEALGDS